MRDYKWTSGGYALAKTCETRKKYAPWLGSENGYWKEGTVVPRNDPLQEFGRHWRWWAQASNKGE